ncbi:hypothetical protein CR513_58935, partial [Mucuna pruriens]
RTSDENENGVKSFLDFAKTHAFNNSGRFYCLFINYFNERRLETWHSKLLDIPSVSQRKEVNVDMDDRLEDVICDIGPESFQRVTMYNMRQKKSLYTRCTNFTRLSTVLRLFNLKAKNGWTNKNMIHDIGLESFQQTTMYDNLCSEVEKSLYKGCTNFTRLSTMLRLFNLKVKMGELIEVFLNCWSF